MKQVRLTNLLHFLILKPDLVFCKKLAISSRAHLTSDQLVAAEGSHPRLGRYLSD